MASHADDLELEGDVEGDVDAIDWTAPASESRDRKSWKPPHRSQQRSNKFSSNRDKTQRVGAKSVLTEKLDRSKEDNVNLEKNRRGQSRNSNLSAKPADTKPDPPKKNLNKTSSDVGDIAGFISSLDSNKKTTVEIISKINKQSDDDKKTDLGVKTPPKSAELLAMASRKRKPTIDDDVDSSKSKKTCNEDNSKDELAKVVEDKDDKMVNKPEYPKDVKRVVSCSEEECRNIDTDLVEEMMEGVKKEIKPRNAEYTVRFSPVELADLAEETVQKLVASQPSLTFYFKRQGKFKKKKGYAEVYLTQMQDARIFIQKLLQIKLVEQCIEVTLTVSRPMKRDEVLSLIISLNKTGPLLKVIKTTEDATKVLHGVRKEHVQVEKAPAFANALLLRALFPFAAEVTFSPEQKKVKSGFRGPVNIYYSSKVLKEAVLDCCSDFIYNGFSLSLELIQRAQVTRTKPPAEVKKDGAAVLERRSSAQDKVKQGDGAKTVKDSNGFSGSHKSTTVVTPQDAGLDADISNMTLDVCTGMMESLNKLRQLGTDNPNIIKILQMQNELATLQQSLSQSKDQSVADPWTVSATEDIDDKQGDCAQEQDKKLSKEPKRKQDKETRADKQKKEMEDLQRIIDEAEEAKIQREERTKRQLEIEKQKMKELEEKRKTNWARRIIEDAKQSAPIAGGENASSKEEAQRLLKIVGNKRKDAEEAKKLEEDAREREKERLKVAADDKSRSEAEQAANNTIEPDDPFKNVGHGHQGTLQQVTQSSQGAPKQDEAGSSVEEQQHLYKDTKVDVAAWSPNRNMHDGAPVYSELEFVKMCSENAAGIVPWNHYVQVSYYNNRRCPVEICPSSKYFKTASCFAVHWDVFHKPNVTVKFCQKCNAYFTNAPELETHLVNRHSITDPEIVKVMSEEAREKVVSNPSFRDPGCYLPPVV